MNLPKHLTMINQTTVEIFQTGEITCFGRSHPVCVLWQDLGCFGMFGHRKNPWTWFKIWDEVTLNSIHWAGFSWVHASLHTFPKMDPRSQTASVGIVLGNLALTQKQRNRDATKSVRSSQWKSKQNQTWHCPRRQEPHSFTQWPLAYY